MARFRIQPVKMFKFVLPYDDKCNRPLKKLDQRIFLAMSKLLPGCYLILTALSSTIQHSAWFLFGCICIYALFTHKGIKR